MAELILASQSPRRRQLLEWAEIPFEVIVSDADESFPSELSPEEAAIYIAKGKAAAISARHAGRLVLAADTIVVLGKDIIGKPVDREDAISILSRLNGARHQVITGVVLQEGERLHSFADKTDVEFHMLTQEQIVYYVDRYRPYDKAGAYAIQEWIGVTGIKSIQGDFYNVMGLPVSRVVQALREFSL